MFTSLFVGGPGPEPEEPGFSRQLRPGLRAIISSGPEGRAISDIRATLDHALEGTVADERDQVINRILRRAILEQIRFHLYQLMANISQLSAAGAESTQLIADALGSYGRWRATPTGPPGRLVFAFTEHREDTGDEPTRLTTAAFGGDPHVYTVSLGDTTALALAGTRRIVLGLSATAYFPFAPHYHVHVSPRWWVSDDNPGTVGAASVDTRISGLDEPVRAEHPAARPAAVGAQTRRRTAAPPPGGPRPGPGPAGHHLLRRSTASSRGLCRRRRGVPPHLPGRPPAP